MSTAIKTSVYTGQLKSKTAIQTANIIKYFNDLLDVLNSMSLYHSNPFKCALSTERPQQLEFLQTAIVSFENLKKKNYTTKGIKENRPVCFDCMCWTLNAIIMLYKEQQNMGFTYILTGRLNSDVIENTFSILRQRGGYNRNPTARTFRTTFRINAKMSLMKPSNSSNCEPDDDIHLMTHSANNDIQTDEDSSESTKSSSESSDSWKMDSIQLEQEAVVTLKNCLNTYFAGYLAMKSILKFPCLNCGKLLIKSIPNKLDFLIFCKNYDSKTSEMHLKVPTSELTQFIILAQKILANILEKKPHRKKLAQFAEKKIKTELISLLDVNETCIPHIEFLIKHIIICKLFRNFNWISKNIKHVRVEKSQKKLKILKNI